MLRLYMLGGEDIEKRDSRSLNEQAFRDAGDSPSVAIFPWASKAKEEKQRRLMVTYFKELGASSVRFVERSLPFTEMVKIAENSDIIYLPNGDTKLLTEMLRDTGSMHLLRLHDNVIIGNSAGALALCSEYIVPTKNGFDDLVLEKGLGLNDFVLCAHYEPEHDDQLETLSKDRSIFAIPDGAAIRSDSCSLSLLGNVELFMDGKKL
jgi:dipeptidase E